jgi:hypothetical protein
MSAEAFDNVYRRGDAIVFVLKHKPYIDLSIPPSANDYRDATCVTIGVFAATIREKLVDGAPMLSVPNRPGWYYFRYQTDVTMKPGVYTAIITAITKIDSIDYTTRNVQEFRLVDDGLV